MCPRIPFRISPKEMLIRVRLALMARDGVPCDIPQGSASMLEFRFN